MKIDPLDSLPPMDPRDFSKWEVFRRIGYTPDEWQHYFHASAAPNRLLACGVRVGKTYCAGAEGTAGALCPSPLSLQEERWVGSRGWVVGNTYDTADKVFRLVWDYLKRYYPFWILKGSSERDKIIRTPGGGFVKAKSAENKDSLIGEELDWAIIDEASRVGEWEKEEVKQRLITRRGWMASISSPTSQKWFMRDFERGQRNGVSYVFEGDPLPGYQYAGRKVRFVHQEDERGFDSSDEHRAYFSIRVPTHANTRLDVEILADWERNMPDRIFRQDVLGEFMASEGAVFHDFDRLMTATKLARARPPRVVDGKAIEPAPRYVLGWDPARTRDFSVVTAIEYGSREQVFLERFKGPWDHQLERVISIARRFNRPDIVVDATGKGDPIAEELRLRNIKAMNRASPEGKLGPFAHSVMPLAITTNAIKRDLVESLAVAIDHGELRLLNDPTQAQELRLFEFKQSDATGVIRYGAPSGFNDDCVLALCLAWHLAARPMGTGAIRMG